MEKRAHSQESMAAGGGVVNPGETSAPSAPTRSAALTGLFILAIFYTLYFTRAILLPFALALLLNFLLRPVINRLEKWHIPPALGALGVLVLFLLTFGVGAYEISKPAAQWLAKAPQMMGQFEGKIRSLRQPIEKVTNVTAKVNQLSTNLGAPNQPAAPKPVEVQVKTTSLAPAFLNSTQAVLSDIVIVFILLFFMLAYGDLFLRKLVKVMPTLSDKKRALTIANEMEQKISTYMFTVTLINSGLGAAVGLGFYFVGMPSPVLWGVMVALLNFIPYLGATVGLCITTVVGILTFNSLGHAMLVPAVYLGCAVVEANFITPFVMGRRLTLNPVVIFIWLIFWGWLWGVLGALMAVPMLAAFKIFCDHIEPLATVGEFLGD